MRKKKVEEEIFQVEGALTLSQALDIRNDAEKAFALICLSKELILIHQIPVGNSVIDFLVINPKSKNKNGKLVEITCESVHILSEKTKLKCPNKMYTYLYYAKMIAMQSLENLAHRERKVRQLKRMQNSGRPHTMLFKSSVKIIMKKYKELLKRNPKFR